ncbi:dTMP kinase [Helicobacter ailurogastricus]|uniref:Thymidylate kinase n=1 Tax=Helicobacter ailurogastricus TaxID=1578720 RepID=A0A0K2X548_9HELI|nr:dTMP kinase [Helicobacter ailurogastricus]CRF41552.1 Thymidylate kinase [Helicobacter ailurogastricus]CRF43261.1 Thymidylate kinase [Helicobacter ailurogastricus]CRF44937.1 Thymidylate kinase [Helicobacter ailurogastricus]CRF52452.1 Thymidylate kinase [Helicobacter ailurogastricus]BDQ29587.1 thymidylate kinase [Helicobacter ailurogastricus]
MFIALEGIDTSGKSTQIALLKEVSPHALFTKEPGGTPLGQALRQKVLHEHLSPSAQFLLFLADRALHLEEVLKPNTHRLVFSDRSLISGLAYAPYPLEQALELHRAHGLLEVLPDRVFVFELKSQALKERLQAKSKDKIEVRGLEFLERTQERILQACQLLRVCTHILDATLSPQSLNRSILEHLSGDD